MCEKEINIQPFEGLIGSAAKRVCEFTLQICELKKRQPDLPLPHFVLSMPPGEGFSTIAAAVADTLFQSNVVKTPHSLSRFLDCEVSEEDADLRSLKEMLYEAASITNAYDGIISCDLKISIRQFKPEHLIHILKESQALWILRISPAEFPSFVRYLRGSGRDFQVLRLPPLTEEEMAAIAWKNYCGTEGSPISIENLEMLVSSIKGKECSSLQCINTVLNDLIIQNGGKTIEEADVHRYIENIADLHKEITKNTIGFVG